MLFKRESVSGKKLKLLLALTGTLVINILIMVLIPWLFRGGETRQELPQRVNPPVFVMPVKSEKDLSRTLKPKPQLEIKVPKPLADVAKPLPLPELNPQIKLSRIKLDCKIDSNLDLTALAESQVSSAVQNPVSRRSFYRIGEVDSEPVNTARIEPVYPFRARRRGVEGSVKVRFFVTPEGRVEGLEIVKAVPAGFFEKVVRQTVAKWHFQPGVVAGVKVKTLVETTIIFKLGR